MPSLIKLHNNFKDKEFVILGVDIKENKQTVKKYVDKTEISYPILLDIKGKVALDYGIRGTPAHILIDKTGDIIAFAPGYKDMANKKSFKLIQFLIDRKY